MKVAAYTRVSTTDQSTEIQTRDITDYCKRRGWDNSVEFYEDKKSGTTENRAELKRMLKDIREGRIDIVITWKIDRLFRSLKNLLLLLQEFEERDVVFVSIKDQIDLTTSSGRMMMHVISAFSEFEVSMIRERVRSGIENARKKGITLGRPKKITVEEVLDLKKDGFKNVEIARKLNVSRSTISRILKKYDLLKKTNQI